MTDDERQVMINTILLAGWELYERWAASKGIWFPALVGAPVKGRATTFFAVITFVRHRTANVDVVIRGTVGKELHTGRWCRIAWRNVDDAKLALFYQEVLR